MTICTFATQEQRAGTAPEAGAELGARAGLGAGDWIGLAAAPTFAAVALVSGLSGGGAHDALCASMQTAGPVSGMTFMYLLMSVFHTAPWLRLIGRRHKRI